MTNAKRKLGAKQSAKHNTLAINTRLANLSHSQQDTESADTLADLSNMQLKKQESKSPIQSPTGSIEFVDVSQMDVDAGGPIQTRHSPSPSDATLDHYAEPPHESPDLSSIARSRDGAHGREEDNEGLSDAASDLQEKVIQDTEYLSEAEGTDEPKTGYDVVKRAFASVKKLPYVEGLLLANNYLHVPVVNIEESFPNTDISRLLAVTAHRGTDSIRNLALCEPGELSYDKWLQHTKSEPFSFFYIAGVFKYCTLYDGEALSKQIGFYPFSFAWYRILALLGKMLNKDVLYFMNYDHVINASTKPASASSDNQPLIPISNKPRKANRNVDGALPSDAHIPVFDGTNGFDLNNLTDTEEFPYEIDSGTAVLVICTINSFSPYKIQVSRNTITKSDLIVSLNLHAIVMVTEGDPEFAEKQKPNVIQDALGVKFPKPRALPPKEDSDKNDENVEADADASSSLFLARDKASKRWTAPRKPVCF